jgi:hypothetical protein
MSLVSHLLEETIHLPVGPSTYRGAVIARVGSHQIYKGKIAFWIFCGLFFSPIGDFGV